VIGAPIGGASIGENLVNIDMFDLIPPGAKQETILQPGPSGPAFTRDRWRHLKELEAQVAEAERRALAETREKARLKAVAAAAEARAVVLRERIKQQAEWQEESRLLALKHALDRTNDARSTAQALEAARMVQLQALAHHDDDDDDEAVALLLMH
jgi:hypothetical protein